MPGNGFKFLDHRPLIDGSLELVAPSIEDVDALLHAHRHPMSVAESPVLGKTTRDAVLDYLSRCPAGHVLPDADTERTAVQHFWMRLRPGAEFGPAPVVTIAGAIGLRIGSGWEVEGVLGHIGYNVYPPVRGHHLAERSCRLLLPLAARYGMDEIWITCNPDNGPSRRTCERLGATLVDTVPVPKDHPLFARGDHFKCRFRLRLA